MLYKKSKSEKLDTSLFKNPTSEYRGTPFWAWNCELKKDELLWQIEQLKEMGFGGFHMHSRSGMATRYLSDDFMDLIKACVEKAEKEDMLAYLYDEDRWPSGAAGGLVTKDRRYSQRNLIITVNKRDDAVDFDEAYKSGGCYFVAAYDVVINNAELTKYKKIDINDKAEGTKWYAYSIITAPRGWYNNQTYIDTLSKSAIDKFIETTYEAYKKSVGDKFGNTVPSIFTDEPQFSIKGTPDFAQSKKDIVLPWTVDFVDVFKKTYGYDILDKLPEIFWELPDGQVSVARYNYHEFVTEKFVQSFADNCGKWCKENDLYLTGHVLSEQSLLSQTESVGEAMRSYRSFGIPGIDILCNAKEFTTAKQAESTAHQYGKEGVLSELYGVTNWDFDFRGHKYQGDWQAALGITLRVPHLSWVSMKGDAKRDYPASLNYQSPWYKEYKYVEDHFARVNTALTRGKPIVKVGVIHPIETYWLHYGTKENTASVREVLDEQFHNVCEWLLSGCIDFDYICESLLPSLYVPGGKELKVGEMEYSAIVIAGCETLRSTTVNILKEYQKAGGKIIFAGDMPKYTDAIPSNDIKELYENSNVIHLSKTTLLDSLKEEKIVDIREENGNQSNTLLYQMREDNDCKWLFIAHLHEEPEAKNLLIPRKRKITVKGEYTPLIYDTTSGDIKNAELETGNGKTVIYYTFYRQDSLLLQLNKVTKTSYKEEAINKEMIKTEHILKKVDYTRSEPNVLLLDCAEYSTDGGEFEPLENMRRIEYLCKDRYKLVNDGTQPWVIEKVEYNHTITLRFKFMSEIELDDALFATENADMVKIKLNGIGINKNIVGYFTDKSIETIKLPKIVKGENVIEATYPLGDRTNMEDCFILGDFNVRLEGVEKTIVEKTNKIGFGDIVMQGLPFYGANITYTSDIEAPCDCDAIIKIGSYAGTVMRVAVDDEDLGIIAYAPYKVTAKNLKKGKHKLSVTLYGNRHNSFGALHMNDEKHSWFGPSAWEFNLPFDTSNKWEYEMRAGEKWKYEYELKKAGILASPEIIYVK